MPDFASTRGFQDAWRNTGAHVVSANADLTTFKPSRPPQSRRITMGDKAKLARVVRKAPEVMVRVGRASSRTKDGAVRPTTAKGEAIRFGNRMSYITRNDKIEVETSDGGIIATAQDRRDLAEEWITDQADYREAGIASERTRLYRSVILSMPPGTDPVSVQDAARAFAQQEFAGHKWIMALHTDTPHPHVHLDIQTVRDDGHKLSPGKDDIERYRDEFASQLRTLGIEAEATPRHARGTPQRAANPDLYHARNRQEHPEKYRWPGQAETPKVDVTTRARVEADPAGALQDRLGDLAAKDRRNGVIDTYLAAADELRKGTPEDRKLAAEVSAFVASMPPYMPRLHMAAHEAIQRDNDRPGRGVAPMAPEASPSAPARPVAAISSEPSPVGLGVSSEDLFAAVYAKPEQALAKWAELVTERGPDRAFDQLRTAPETLGALHGWHIVGIDSGARREASERFTDLVVGLRAGLDAATAKPVLDDAKNAEPPAAATGSAETLRAELAALLAERQHLAELQKDAMRRMAENAPDARSPAPPNPSQGDKTVPEKDLGPTPPARRDRPKEPDIDR